VARIVSEALIERLADWGVDTVFGLPGDGINGIMEGLRRHQDRLRLVLVRHEEAAAFMATAHAKATGKIGVCLATSSRGGIHLLNGLYDAKLDHVPVLAITGMQVLGTGYQQEVALDRLYADVAEYNQMIDNPAQVKAGTDMAIRTAYARRGVARITIPNDIQVARADADPWQHVAPTASPQASPVYPRPAVRPAEADLRRLADFLNEGEKIAILAGAGALPAREELLTLAGTLGAPIVKTLSGKAAVPDDSPYTTGGIWLLGTKPSQELMEEVDTLFLVGTNFPCTRHLPSSARIAQVDADVRETLRGVMPLLKQRAPTPFLGRYQEKIETWRSRTAALEDPSRDPIAPQYLMGVINDLATDDAILTCDSGTIATWAARHWTIRGNRGFYLSGNLATMAPGLPYAIGIQPAFPGRQVIAFVGDGGFSMLMAEFLTAIRHQLPVKVVISNNNSLGYPGSPVNFAAFASTNGAFGAKVDRPADVREAMSLALASPGPAVVDVNVNPDEPLPVKAEHERQYPTDSLMTPQSGLRSALSRGQPLTSGLPGSYPRCVMRTNRLRYTGLAIVVLVLIGGLVAAWFQLSLPLFLTLASTVVFFVALFMAGWDGWHQTTPTSLESRGMYPDDRKLQVFDPGLRREYTPMLPFALGARTSGGGVRRTAAPSAVRSQPSAPRPRPAAAPRVAKAKPAWTGQGRQRGGTLQSDATITLASESRDSGIEDVLQSLEIELVGLRPVKKKVAEVGSLLLVDRARQRFGLSASRPNLHMCFTGPPGTGKTTVALMMADLLTRLGYLEKGQVVHAMRDDLVGEYIGQTAPKTKAVLARAMGGVLFIDEAYSLYRTDDSRDYGQECIDILMQVMENDRDNLVVILAGYKDRMDHFFESNPGMVSRVAHHLDFAAYQADELLAIGQLMLDKSHYYLSAEARTALGEYLSQQMTQPQFANARSVRNALENARLRHASRLVAEPDRPWSKDDLMRLETSDILPGSNWRS